MRFILASLLLAASAGIASGQQPQSPPDPAVVAMKLGGVQSLLDFRERQIIDLNRQAEAERAYWAAYVAGLKPDK